MNFRSFLRRLGFFRDHELPPVWNGQVPPKLKEFVIRRELRLPWRLGARAGAVLAETARKYGASVEFMCEDHIANVKDLMELQTLSRRVLLSKAKSSADAENLMQQWEKTAKPEELDLQAGTPVTIIISGADAEEAMADLERVFRTQAFAP